MSKIASASDLAHKIAQECVQNFPVLILGSGASATHGIPGMFDLKNHLLNASPPEDLYSNKQNKWQEFHNSLRNVDLETALTETQLPIPTTRYVVEKTWNSLILYDLKVFDQCVQDRGMFPLTRLYQHLFKSTHCEINVVTPNYDRLAEYAADSGEIFHFTGFGYGHLRLRAKDIRPKVPYRKASPRIVNVWKVHGSLDWFKDKDGIVMALPIPRERPSSLEPVIVTPGIEKYRLTHEEPLLSIKQGADSALQSARSYLCIGYGFNDSHIQTKLVERCRTESVPLVLITKEITPTAKDFLRSGNCQYYLAIEKNGMGSRIFTAECPEGVEIKDRSLWQLDQFLAMVMA